MTTAQQSVDTQSRGAKFRRWRMGAIALVACGLAGVSGCTGNGEERGFVFFPGMHYSVPYDSFDNHETIGLIQRSPAAGTVKYGSTPILFGKGKEEALRAGRELHAPWAGGGAPTPEMLTRGKKAFGIFCEVCHGPGGEGDGPIIGAGRFPNPPSLLASHARELPDGQLYHIIYRGQGLMPSYAVQVAQRDIWPLVSYVRQVQAEKEVAQ